MEGKLIPTSMESAKGQRACNREVCLSRGKLMPDPLFHQAVLLLLTGMSAAWVAGWLLDQPEYAEFQDYWEFEALRMQLAKMRRHVRHWLAYPKLELAPSWLKEVFETYHK